MSWTGKVRSFALVIAGALALGTGCASAADVVFDPVAAPPSPEAPSSIYVWSGPYAGAFVGYNFSRFRNAPDVSFDGDGAVGGVYAGYNFESGPIVYGVEADFGGSGVDGTGFSPALGGDVGGDQNIFGSLRGRVGYQADPFLVFATGGVAASRNELTSGGDSDAQTSVGFTVGAGVEAKITDDVAGRLEYRYSKFGSETYDLGNTSVSSGFDEHSIRAGVALKF
ncbi:outer membrane protein [Aurantimonas sp. 22II-16-19i]|uniref:outer membrane protein n=1 Tax=Aurantimonas sp. 22II-16-19i TaxID=1317114 RepID=UPI0009F7EADE|nr:outer membrane protein [Aurantimonas sp. 22II-16-19i]ORE91459.1 outer membrane protein [Aurantimonas sp. 22II-16-19i]